MEKTIFFTSKSKIIHYYKCTINTSHKKEFHANYLENSEYRKCIQCFDQNKDIALEANNEMKEMESKGKKQPSMEKLKEREKEIDKLIGELELEKTKIKDEIHRLEIAKEMEKLSIS
jgi:hypothetical protein